MDIIVTISIIIFALYYYYYYYCCCSFCCCLGKYHVSKNRHQNGEWSDHQSGQWTVTKLSCNKTDLKRSNKTEMRWNKKLPSRSSPEQALLLRPRSTRNCRANSCIGPRRPSLMPNKARIPIWAANVSCRLSAVAYTTMSGEMFSATSETQIVTNVTRRRSSTGKVFHTAAPLSLKLRSP